MEEVQSSIPKKGSGGNRKRKFQKKVNTNGKWLKEPMRGKLEEAVERHLPLIVLIAKEQAGRYGIPEEFNNGRPEGWFADLVSAGIYGMCRGALAWQQKELEGLRTTDFDGELKQAARVRIKQLAKKIYKYRRENELVKYCTPE